MAWASIRPMLVEMHNRGIRPDLIQHAHTGGEWPHTFAYRKVIDAWLKSVEFPAIVDCRYVPKTARYNTLEGNCLANETLPSLAFGKHSCSIKFKAEPQNRYLPIVASCGRVLGIGRPSSEGAGLRRWPAGSQARHPGAALRTAQL